MIEPISSFVFFFFWTNLSSSVWSGKRKRIKSEFKFKFSQIVKRIPRICTYIHSLAYNKRFFAAKFLKIIFISCEIIPTLVYEQLSRVNIIHESSILNPFGERNISKCWIQRTEYINPSQLQYYTLHVSAVRPYRYSPLPLFRIILWRTRNGRVETLVQGNSSPEQGFYYLRIPVIRLPR